MQKAKSELNLPLEFGIWRTKLSLMARIAAPPLRTEQGSSA